MSKGRVNPNGKKARAFYRMHVGTHNRYGTGRNKKIYRTYWQAWLAMARVKLRKDDEQQAYRCYWTDDEQWLEYVLHWHLGHSRYHVWEFDDQQWKAISRVRTREVHLLRLQLLLQTSD